MPQRHRRRPLRQPRRSDDVEVALEYEPPAGTAGKLVARVFENPEAQVEDALERFKEIVESW